MEALAAQKAERERRARRSWWEATLEDEPAERAAAEAQVSRAELLLHTFHLYEANAKRHGRGQGKRQLQQRARERAQLEEGLAKAQDRLIASLERSLEAARERNRIAEAAARSASPGPFYLIQDHPETAG